MGPRFAQVNSGADCPCFGVAFQLSHVEGTTESATAMATLVRLYGARHGYPAPSPLPRIGQRVVLRLRNGKIDDPLTGRTTVAWRPRALPHAELSEAFGANPALERPRLALHRAVLGMVARPRRG